MPCCAALGVLVTLLQAPAPPPGDLAAVSFIAGHWVGIETKDLSEEVWLPPAAGAMVGMWRWASGGETLLVELLTIAKEPAGVVMRLRHFRPDMTALEEKDKPFVLPLVDARPNAAVFQGTASDGGPLRITYRLAAPDRLEASVEKGGSTQRFAYRRQR